MTGPRLGALSGTLPGGGARNGLPDPVGYEYRGKQKLDDSNSYLCEGGCGRRLENKPGPRMGMCAVCRGAWKIEAARRQEHTEQRRAAR